MMDQTCDAEKNSAERNPTIPARLPEIPVNVVGGERSHNAGIERNQIVHADGAIAEEPGKHHGRKQEGDATRADVLQGEEEHQNEA